MVHAHTQYNNSNINRQEDRRNLKKRILGLGVHGMVPTVTPDSNSNSNRQEDHRKPKKRERRLGVHGLGPTVTKDSDSKGNGEDPDPKPSVSKQRRRERVLGHRSDTHTQHTEQGEVSHSKDARLDNIRKVHD